MKVKRLSVTPPSLPARSRLQSSISPAALCAPITQPVNKFPRHNFDSLSLVSIIIDQECGRLRAVEAIVGHKQHNPPIRQPELLYFIQTIFYSKSLDAVQNVTTGNSTHLASFHSLRSFTYLRHIDPDRQGHTTRFLRRCRLRCFWKLQG